MIAEKEFSNNLESVQEKIAIACEASDRALKEVTLLPVTKNWSADAVKLCKGSGITRVGENRVQEAIQKMEVVQGVEFDLIGHLQGNKAKQVIGKFSCIQSVDSLKLLEKLERLARRNNLIQPILLQINAGNDPAKHGISIENTPQILEKALNIPSLKVNGFMTIAPYDPEDKNTARKTFENLRNLRDKMRSTFGHPLNELSMGMSGDLTEAIAEGSTMIRVGSALFGLRNSFK